MWARRSRTPRRVRAGSRTSRVSTLLVRRVINFPFCPFLPSFAFGIEESGELRALAHQTVQLLMCDFRAGRESFQAELMSADVRIQTVSLTAGSDAGRREWTVAISPATHPAISIGQLDSALLVTCRIVPDAVPAEQPSRGSANRSQCRRRKNGCGIPISSGRLS